MPRGQPYVSRAPCFLRWYNRRQQSTAPPPWNIFWVWLGCFITVPCGLQERQNDCRKQTGEESQTFLRAWAVLAWHSILIQFKELRLVCLPLWREVKQVVYVYVCVTLRRNKLLPVMVCQRNRNTLSVHALCTESCLVQGGWVFEQKC